MISCVVVVQYTVNFYVMSVKIIRRSRVKFITKVLVCRVGFDQLLIYAAHNRALIFFASTIASSSSSSCLDSNSI